MEAFLAKPVTVACAFLLVLFFSIHFFATEMASSTLPLVVANTFMGNFFVW
jgi:hypothetical protein